MLELIRVHAWLGALVAAAINALLTARRAQSYGAPKDHAWRVAIGINACLTLPFWVMGAGVLSGAVARSGHFLQPATPSGWKFAFFAACGLVWLTAAVWVFLRGGDQTLASYRLIRIRLGATDSGALEDPTHVRLFLVVCLIGGFVGLGLFLARA